MKPDKKARQYAQVLFRLSRDTDCIQALGRSLSVLDYLVRKDAVFRMFFYTLRIPAPRKAVILQKVLADQCHPLAAEFAAILSERREWTALNPTLKAYLEICRVELNQVSIVAYTAKSLPDAEIRQMQSRLDRVLGQSTELRTVVDPDLLGGIKLRIGNLFVDGSVQSHLHRLRRVLIQS